MTDRIYTFKTFTKKKKCEICGKMFKPNTRTQKYCSEQCYRGVVKDYQDNIKEVNKYEKR